MEVLFLPCIMIMDSVVHFEEMRKYPRLSFLVVFIKEYLRTIDI